MAGVHPVDLLDSLAALRARVVHVAVFFERAAVGAQVREVAVPVRVDLERQAGKRCVRIAGPLERIPGLGFRPLGRRNVERR
ncbi:MAG: hypothetical protein V3R47_06670, partial [candidate division NC10 bacterium]